MNAIFCLTNKKKFWRRLVIIGYNYKELKICRVHSSRTTRNFHLHRFIPTTLLINIHQARVGVFFYATNKHDGYGLGSTGSSQAGFQMYAVSTAK